VQVALQRRLSVVTPIGGRPEDMFGKKWLLVVVPTGLAVGTLIGALATSLALMIVARTIQGLGVAIFPLAFGTIRDMFPRERVVVGIALVDPSAPHLREAWKSGDDLSAFHGWNRWSRERIAAERAGARG
jgi:MFS transporter